MQASTSDVPDDACSKWQLVLTGQHSQLITANGPLRQQTTSYPPSTSYPSKAMAFFGLRKWSTPIFKPLWPFMVAGGITTYLVAQAQSSGVKSAEWRNDPRNPYAAQLAKESLH
ncbi:hypothetical protein D9619_005206 [Psilocybe cf. subviscida]|uniref:ATP synthase subunit J, mitochondrial n=1 Tax=Psilocybe cf. subviscida TaxID=2480587 RepID=A0A8H5BZ10_9AGAR|nr:hypothetical protein D9619_005206 [Psilocybe cf. subviscida]